MPGGLLVVGPSDSLANKQEQLLAMQAELQREQQARAQAEAVTLICKYAIDAYIAMVMNGLAAELVTQAALKQLVDNFVASLAQEQQAPLTAAKVAEQLPQGQEFDALCRQVVRNATPSPTPSEHEEQAPSRLVKVPSATDLSKLMQKGTRSAPPSPGRRLSGRKGSEGELPNFDFQDLASRAQRSGSARSLPDLENAPYQSVSIEQLLEDQRTFDQYFAARFSEFQQRLKTQSPAPTHRSLQTPPTPERGLQPDDSERAKRTLFVGERGEQKTPAPTSLADLVAQVDVPEAGLFPQQLGGRDLEIDYSAEVASYNKSLNLCLGISKISSL